MYRVVKSELMKWFSGKMIYISVMVTALLTTADHVATKLLSEYDPQAVPGLIERFEMMSAQEYMTSALVSLISGGAIFIIVTIITAIIITEDYEKGTMKYFLMAVSRKKLMTGKILSMGIINLLLIIAAFISSVIVGVIGYEWQQGSYSILQIISVYFLGWLTLSGFSSLLMFVFNKVNKVTGAIGIGIAIFMILGIVGVVMPESIRGFVISADFHKAADMDPASLRQTFLAGSIYVLIFSLLNLIAFKNKEMLR